MAHYSAGPILFESVSAVTATNSVELGSRVFYGGSEYLYVYNNGTAINQYYGAMPATGCSGYSVCVSSVSAVSPLVGVAANATIPANNYGWLLTKGYCNVKNDRVSSALASSSTEVCNLYLGVNGQFDWHETSGSTAVSARLYCGFATGTGVSGGTGTSYFGAYIRAAF